MDEDAVHKDAAVAVEEELSPTKTELDDTPTEPLEENVVPAGVAAQSQKGGSAKGLRWQSANCLNHHLEQLWRAYHGISIFEPW